jgi:hypothetical protein
MRLPRTTRHLMLVTAVIALVLGLVINFRWLVPCIIIMAIVTFPQSLVVGLCAYLATRDPSRRKEIKWLGEVETHRSRGVRPPMPLETADGASMPRTRPTPPGHPEVR